jgi:hypothetical protein
MKAKSQSSPLYQHITPGQLITHLDDISVAGEGDIWSQFLRQEISGAQDQGWCINKDVYNGTSSIIRSKLTNQAFQVHHVPLILAKSHSIASTPIMLPISNV